MCHVLVTIGCTPSAMTSGQSLTLIASFQAFLSIIMLPSIEYPDFLTTNLPCLPPQNTAIMDIFRSFTSHHFLDARYQIWLTSTFLSINIFIYSTYKTWTINLFSRLRRTCASQISNVEWVLCFIDVID